MTMEMSRKIYDWVSDLMNPILHVPVIKKVVALESPFRADNFDARLQHAVYLRAAMRYCFLHGAMPIATHAFYTEALNDDRPTERRLGIDTRRQFLPIINEVWVFADLGITEGMADSIKFFQEQNKMIVTIRALGGEPNA